MDRDSIREQDHLRQLSRAKLKTDIDQARQDLHPKEIATRWKAKQKAKVDDAKAHAEQLVKKNAVLIAAMGVGALLFTARRPILKVAGLLKNKMRSDTVDKDQNDE